VFLLAGRTQTDLHRSQTADPALGLRFPVFVLTRDGDDLDARIAARTEAMLARGWIEETRALLGCHRADGPGLCSIGYREIVRYLGGDLPRRGLTPAIVRATRQYAKRQRTWFRALDARGRGHPDDPALVSTLLGLLGAP